MNIIKSDIVIHNLKAEKLKNILKEKFGHSDFRLHQKMIIESVIEGRDVLGVMPTGGGKSVCYQLPALYFEGISIIISPLISLMRDQVTQLSENGIPACYLNSELSWNEKEIIEEKICDGEVKIVYVSPEGVLSNYLLDFFKGLNISLIAIDEAHCVSQWGHEFRKDYIRLGELKDYFPDVPFLALTATADSRTRNDIVTQLKFKSDHEKFVSSFDRSNITYTITDRVNELKQLDEFIKANHSGQTGIVYCLSRKKVEKITKDLQKLGHNAHAYHAGLSSSVKAKAQDLFNTEECVIIVATIAFGMGINRPDVRFVAHLDLPKSIESYYQETGRAGRDGIESSAWMIYGFQDVIKLSQMLEMTEASETYKKSARSKLDSMLTLCETTNCRRNYLLSYFEEEAQQACGNCDVCLYPVDKVDALENAQKILSCIYRTGQIFGANYLIEVLRGSKNSKVLERRHDQLSVHGIGSDKPKTYWNRLLRQLLSSGYIAIKNWEYRNLCLTAKSSEILKGEKNLYIRNKKDNDSNKNKKRNKLAEVNHGRGDLFEELRSLRKSLSSDKGVPPYIIFSDKSLHDMCQLLPRDKSEFLMVNGVGQRKCEQYSKDFLQIIRSHS